VSPIARFMVDTVTRVRPAWVEDRYGNLVPDYEGGERADLQGWFTTTATAETTGGRQAITTEVELTLLPEADVELSDRFEHESRVYRIMGDIGRARRPAGQHHIVVRLQRVEG